jgi:hypothetical protein
MADGDHSSHSGASQRLSDLVFYAENLGFETDTPILGLSCRRGNLGRRLGAPLSAGQRRGAAHKDDAVRHMQRLIYSNKDSVFVVFSLKR